jgi:hypothetical protein
VNSTFKDRLTSEVAAKADVTLRHWVDWLSSRPSYALGHNPGPARALEQDLHTILDALGRLQLIIAEEGENSETTRIYCSARDRLFEITASLRSLRARWRSGSSNTIQTVRLLREARQFIMQLCILITGQPPDTPASTGNECAEESVNAFSYLLTTS